MKKFRNVSNIVITAILFCWLFTACDSGQTQSITILHTNDTHSQIDPIAEGKRDGNHAGYARRMGLIHQERQNDPELLLFDSGDFLQGTPYFNFFHGRVEVDAFNRMGYDAITLGNHEFDYGIDTLAAILQDAKFEVLSANYDVSNTPLEGIVKPYTIIRRKGIKIGVLGLGVNPKGLIADKNFAPIRYLDPIPVAQEIATLLKEKYGCELVICLSHMGTFEHEEMVSDTQLAKATTDIDIIIGAHTHKVVTNHYVENLKGDSIFLAQMGKSGARLGKISLKMHE